MPQKDYSRTVYSTEIGRICPNCGHPQSDCKCIKKMSRPPIDGVVRVALEKKGRGGKTVSLISGLPGDENELRELIGELKRRCGSGGTLKNGAIEIQGDHRDILVATLRSRGLTVKKVGG